MSKGKEPREGSMLEVRRYTERNVKRARRFKKRPCGSDAPVAPTNLNLSFVNTHKERRRRWQGKARWDEVVLNEYGADTTCERYAVQVQHSTDGATPVGETRRYSINAKDEDADTTAHVILERVARRYYYRFRVLAINKSGCRSSWSSWTAWQQPGAEGPPSPTNVKVYANSTDRVVVEWSAPADPVDADVIDQDIDYFQVQLSISLTFATNYKFDRFQASMRKSFKVDDTESGGSTYYVRVRSVNSEGDKSDWIPATTAGNSSSGATPDGVSPAAGGGGKIVASWSKPGRARVKHYANRRWTNTTGVRLYFAKARATCGDKDASTGAPTGAGTGLRFNLRRWLADESAHAPVFDAGGGTDDDDRLWIDAGTYKDVNGPDTFDITYLDPDEALTVKVVQVGSTYPGDDWTVQLFMEP